jgi:hypothetical protein
MRPTFYVLFKTIAAAIALSVVAPRAAFADVLIVAPEANSAERRWFAEVQGAAATELRRAGEVVREISLDTRNGHTTLLQQIGRGPESIVALGRTSLTAIEAADYRGRLTVGAVDMPVGEVAPNRSVITLTPNPLGVLRRLKEVLPGTRRVIVVATPRRLLELRGAIHDAASDEKLVAVFHEANTDGEAGAAYLNVLRFGNPSTDVLWIVESSELFSSELLPRIVEVAWAHRFPVISNVVDHVNKGALLAPFPNPERLGAELGRQASRETSTGRATFVSSLSFAGNLRAARHLVPAVNLGEVERAELVVGKP